MGTIIRFVHIRDKKRRDTEIREAVTAEAATLILAGEPEAAKALLRDYIAIALAEAASDSVLDPDIP